MGPEGLVSQATAPAGVPAAPVEQAVPGQPTGEEAATPDEQEAYDAALAMISELIYNNEESSEAIIAQLGQSEPMEAIVTTMEFLMDKVEEGSGGQVPETAIIPIADEATDLIIELGEEAGVFDLQDEEIVKVKGLVVASIMEMYGVEEEDMAELMQGMSPGEVEEYAAAFGG